MNLEIGYLWSHKCPKKWDQYTLIALVITIVILIILAGVAINLSLGENGLFDKAVGAKEEYKVAVNEEQAGIANIQGAIDTITNGGNSENVEDKVIISLGETTHIPRTLTYSWEELEKIAEVISDNDDKVNSDTAEAKITINEIEYVVGVGDTVAVTYDGVSKTVRIMGFNHDTLTSTSAYGEGKTNTYAGISFEFMNVIMSIRMNSSNTNINGWGKSAICSTLNSETEINKLTNKDVIKKVNKTYLLGNKSTTTQISQDKLWLLSCSEIWNNGKYTGCAYGEAIAKEGEQYKYYKNINANCSKSNTNLVKDSACCWLRSPYFNQERSFCCLENDGTCGADRATSSYKIAPGFAI